MRRGVSAPPPDGDTGSAHLLQEQDNSSSGAVDAQSSAAKAGPDGAKVTCLASPSKSMGFACHCARLLWGSGLTCSFLASLIFSFSGLFVKLTGGRVPLLEVCLVRSAISFGLTIVLMKSAKMSPIFGQRSNLRLLFMRGCCGACSMTTWYIGLFLLPLGDCVTINLIGPAVTALVARAFLKEPLGYRGAAGCVVSMLGVVVLAHPPFLFGGHENWDRARALGTAASLLSAVLGSGSSLTIRLIGNREPAAVIAMWFHTCTMILSAIPLALGVPDKVVLLSGKDSSLLLGVAGTSFVAQLLSTRGLQMVVAAKAAAMGFSQVFYSYIMGAIFFGERVSLMGLAGVVLILLGVLMVTMRSSSKGAAVTKAASTSLEATAAVAGVTTQRSSPLGAVRAASPALVSKQAASLAATRANSSTTAKAGLEEDSCEQPLLLKGLYTGSSAATSATGDASTRESTTGCNAADPLLLADAAVIIQATRTGAAAAAGGADTTAVVQGGSTAAARSIASSRSWRERPGTISAFVQAALQAEASDGECPGELLELDLEKQLARVAAEAAAALGGELCPATTASLAHTVSHVSRHASSRTASCLNRHRSYKQTAVAGAHSTVPGRGATDGAAGGAAGGVIDGNGTAGLPASQPIPIPQVQPAAPRLSRQVTSWLANSLLAVSPEQRGDGFLLHEALLDTPAMSPAVSPGPAGGLQQQHWPHLHTEELSFAGQHGVAAAAGQDSGKAAQLGAFDIMGGTENTSVSVAAIAARMTMNQCGKAVCYPTMNLD